MNGPYITDTFNINGKWNLLQLWSKTEMARVFDPRFLKIFMSDYDCWRVILNNTDWSES